MRVKPVAAEQEKRQKAAQYLNERVSQRYGFLALAAFASQQEIADQRDVVVGRDRISASRTSRGRPHNRLT
ncbi:hypothetical protein SBDP1_1530003 [Syntrophobacter sp. SbD1]|nr:hypothetical protein SBDP1_1530003 [Syntrophobacter sp. SbD1]